MIKKTVSKKSIEYSDVCNHCGKVIIGNSEEQVKYNLRVHTTQKHKGGKK